ncbi:MAG: LuxR C-terminal-related transcriptional regulator [Chloroflexota bacterium]
MLPQTYRTFILDDQYYQQEAIKAILNKIPEIEIVGIRSTVSESLEICQQKKPDLIVVDGQLYGDNNLSPNFVKTIRKTLPQARILGMTRYPECIDLLKRAGCDFVVDKNLIESQDSALKFIKETVLPRTEHSFQMAAPKLTEHEDKVLKYICDGLTEEQIAVELGFGTRKPVRVIKNVLFNKFNALNVAHLVHLAHLSGYLHPGNP